HTFADDGTYLVHARVLDDDGGVTDTMTTVVVHNIEPTIDLSGADTVTAGSMYTLTLGAVHDPGQDTVRQYIVHWGDGRQDVYTRPGNVTHVYSNVFGLRTIRVALVDEDGTHPLAGQKTVLVTGAGIIDGRLWVVGTNGDDHVHINQQGNGLLKVHANFFVGVPFVTFPLAPLDAILAEWNSGRDYATRAQNIRTGSGPLLSSAFRLQAGVTVFNDADVDDFTGAAGADWLFADLGRDRVRDKKSFEWLDP